MPLFLLNNSRILNIRSPNFRSPGSRPLSSRTLRKGLLVAACAAAGLLWALAASSAERPQQVENLRLWHSPERTRVVFDVSANVNHRMFILQNPLRLVVDIENVDFSIKLPQINPDNKHISAIRSGRPDSKSLRFVFELKQPLKTSDFVLSPNELYGHRLVIDLEEQGILAMEDTSTNTVSSLLATGSAKNQERAPSGGTVPALIQKNASGSA